VIGRRASVGIKLLAVTVPATLVALLLVVGGVEVWTRIRWNPLKGTPGFFLSDPVRIQRLAPGYRGWFAGVPVAINQLGFRDDREYTLGKSPRTFRIVLLGDSVTFGHGSVFEHSYPRLLEDRLRAWRPDVDWQVWNLGVPGYNTSQELANLLEVGPAFQPDLVIVGFFENDVVGNFPVQSPGMAARIKSATVSWLYRHVYSIELYKRLYLQIAWRFSGQTSYRQRLDHLGEERQLIENVQQIQDLKDQQLSPFDWLDDEAVGAVRCPDGPLQPPDLLETIRHEPGWDDWLTAVRRLQALHRDGAYALSFFIQVAPTACLSRDVFFDGGTAALNRFYTDILTAGVPGVSPYDAFRHTRPSQMPLAAGHALGNANAVKADVLFHHLREDVLPSLRAPRAQTVLQSRPTP
jgi:hypothetical protein